MAARTLVLASASPARLRLLGAAGIDPVVVVSGVDEDDLDPGDPEAMVATLARRKAEAVAARLAATPPAQGTASPHPAPPGAPTAPLVLGADSTLELDGRAHGKPRTAEVAQARWRTMAGRHGDLLTGHHLVDLATGRSATAVGRTRVHFSSPGAAEVDAYVATGEPLEVAGGFTLDGIGSAYVERIEGEATNVIGLSIPLLRRLAGDLGTAWTDLWR